MRRPRQFIADDKHHAALGFDRLKYTLSVEESKAINFTNPPYVVISASGMAETGRILHHLKNHIEDSRNTSFDRLLAGSPYPGAASGRSGKRNQDLRKEIYQTSRSSHDQRILRPCRPGRATSLRQRN